MDRRPPLQFRFYQYIVVSPSLLASNVCSITVLQRLMRDTVRPGARASQAGALNALDMKRQFEAIVVLGLCPCCCRPGDHLTIALSASPVWLHCVAFFLTQLCFIPNEAKKAN